MKFITVFSALCLFAVGISAHTLEKHAEVVSAILKECQSKEGGTDADFESLVAQKTTGTRESNCMISCAFEKVGMMKDGKLDKNVFMLMAKMLVGANVELLKAAEEIADECAPKMDASDRCDDAFKFEKCMHDAVKSRKLNVGHAF